MEQSGLEQIKNYLEVKPGIYTGGQPTAEQINLLGDQGFNILINLATSTSPDALQNEQEIAQNAGMAYVHIPVEWQNPTKKDLIKFFLMFEQHKGFKTFVHCVLNMRVSVFIYLYRVIIENEDPDICLWSIREIWEPNEVWQKFIDEMLIEIPHPANDINWQFEWKGYAGL